MRWRYSIVTLSTDARVAEEELNQMGHAGWELVQVVTQRTDAVGIFKRGVDV